MISINYAHLAQSQEHYSMRGFEPVDAPWRVTAKVIQNTYPFPPGYEITDSGKHLVASGEQSFLYMMTKGQLPPGKYQTITPCFRHEVQDELHRKEFMKNELIDTYDVSTGSLQTMIGGAMKFFEIILGEEPRLIQTFDSLSLESYDLEFRGIELGSYGIRKRGFFEWVYGTGCAEPRLSAALIMAQNNR